MSKKYYTYILLTEKNTYYCGYSDDVEKRFEKHKQGLAAKYTKAFKPIKIVYVKAFDTKQEAQKEEYRIKHTLNRAQKDKLVREYENSLKENKQ